MSNSTTISVIRHPRKLVGMLINARNSIHVRWSTVGISTAIVIFGVSTLTKFMDIFPQIEYRQQAYMDTPMTWIISNAGLRGENMWSIPFSFNRALGKICGVDYVCANSLIIILNIASAVLLSLLAIRFSISRLVALCVGVFWLTSLPAFDSFAWQATNLDKLASFQVLCGIHLALTYLRSEIKMKTIISANLALLLIVVTSYNSKPSAWILVPAFYLLFLCSTTQNLWRWCACLILPTSYALAHNFYWISKINADKFYKTHISSGSPKVNFLKAVGIINGSDHNSVASMCFFVAIISILLLSFRMRDNFLTKVGIWSVLVTFGSLIIPLKSQFMSPFYLLVGQLFYAITLGCVFNLIINRVRHVRSSAIVVTTAVTLLVVNGYYQNLEGSKKPYDRIFTQSQNFVASIEIIKKTINVNTGSIVLVYRPEDYSAYRFLDGGELGRYLSGPTPINDQQISLMTTDDFIDTASRPGTIYFIYDERLLLTKIVKPTIQKSVQDLSTSQPS